MLTKKKTKIKDKKMLIDEENKKERKTENA